MQGIPALNVPDIGRITGMKNNLAQNGQFGKTTIFRFHFNSHNLVHYLSCT
jgi:hypothetical protein